MEHSTQVEPRVVAAERVDQAIGAVADAFRGQTGGHERAHSTPGEPGHDTVIELAAVRLVNEAVHTGLTGRVQACRAAGVTWQEIGEGLDLQPLARVLERPVAEIAFEHVTGGAGSHADHPGPMLRWTCPECGREISDYGPAEPAQANADQAHAEDCPRRSA